MPLELYLSVLGVKVIEVLVYKKALSFGWHEFENTTVEMGR